MVIILFVIFIVAMIENYFTKLFCLYFLHSQEFLTYKTWLFYKAYILKTNDWTNQYFYTTRLCLAKFRLSPATISILRPNLTEKIVDNI